jgi:hypothetical protein
MPGHRLNAHVAAQATDHATELAREPTAPINKFAMLHAPFVLTDKHLRQLKLDHAGVTKQRDISDLSADMPVDTSLLTSHGVYCLPAPITTAVNEKLLRLFVQYYLIDALPLEAQ